MNPLKAISVTDFLAVDVDSGNFQIDIYSVEGDLLGEYTHNTGTYTPGVSLSIPKQIYLQISGSEPGMAGTGYFEIELDGSGTYIPLYINYEPASDDRVYFNDDAVAFADENLEIMILGYYHTELSIGITEDVFEDVENFYSESVPALNGLHQTESEHETAEPKITFDEAYSLNDYVIEHTESVNFEDGEDYLVEEYSSTLYGVDITESYYLYSSGTLDIVAFEEYYEGVSDNTKGIVDKVFFTEKVFYETILDSIEELELIEDCNSDVVINFSSGSVIKEATRSFLQYGHYEASITSDKVVIYDSILARNLPTVVLFLNVGDYYA